MITPAIKPLVRIAVTFAIVWFYHSLTGRYLSGWVQIALVVALAIPTWVLVVRLLFPADRSGTLDPFATEGEEDRDDGHR